MAFFQPRRALRHEGRGSSGALYFFTKDAPTEVTDPRDVQKFRNQRDVLLEVDAAAKPAEQPRQSAESQTINRPDGTLTMADLGVKGTTKAAEQPPKPKVSRKAKK